MIATDHLRWGARWKERSPSSSEHTTSIRVCFSYATCAWFFQMLKILSFTAFALVYACASLLRKRATFPAGLLSRWFLARACAAGAAASALLASALLPSSSLILEFSKLRLQIFTILAHSFDNSFPLFFPFSFSKSFIHSNVISVFLEL